MPTISEPTWVEQEARTQRILDEFAYGNDSQDVLRARLYGNGLRGIDLDAAYRIAVCRRNVTQAKPPQPAKVFVMERDGTQSTIRFRDEFHAGEAVKLLRKQPNVLFANRV